MSVKKVVAIAVILGVAYFLGIIAWVANKVPG